MERVWLERGLSERYGDGLDVIFQVFEQSEERVENYNFSAGYFYPYNLLMEVSSRRSNFFGASMITKVVCLRHLVRG